MDRYIIGRLNVVKMAILSKLICRFNSLHIKIPTGYFVENDNAPKIAKGPSIYLKQF